MSDKAHPDRSLEYHRIQFDPLEAAFANQWESENERHAGRNHGFGLLELLAGRELAPRERAVAATAIQWLGTNCGFAFLQECLNKVGLRITGAEEWKYVGEDGLLQGIALAESERHARQMIFDLAEPH